MSERRYFYTDPLAAAWMAKHFGLRFQNGLGVNLHFNQGMSGRHWFCPHDQQHVDYYGNFYIDPDCLHLLEPQAGDYCFIKNERIERCDEIASEQEIGGKARHVILMDGNYRLRSEVKRIMSRVGLTFHWPESEDV